LRRLVSFQSKANEKVALASNSDAICEKILAFICQSLQHAWVDVTVLLAVPFLRQTSEQEPALVGTPF
jgi:hypothetical protein